MAFDQNTRNRLQKFVSEARAILTEEFTRQLQATYGMDPKNGIIAELDTLNFLDNQARQTATILRETLAHYVTSLSDKSEKERTNQALDRIIREQAFTVLNRLGALRMAEARGFLLESIAKGYSSKGFQLYKNLAGTSLGETGDAYRQYLFSLFDEFSQDLAVLFDRHSSQGRLFPRESALLALLDQINHFEIENLWAEDEIIGWIYQYFNSQEERKRMRAESQAPRNSRELAVRNQFFTPRYVVEFLTDNTLGRLWYEMTQGKTALVEKCRYLVRRPNEIFLVKGESAPDKETERHERLSHDELLNQPVYTPFRVLKDPRELRMLDPACGSMHFGLYAFDLFEKIYEEAWQLETELGPDAFDRSNDIQPLKVTYSSFNEFRKDIPKLIIECNIHGVDIDPRAVQIAGLSLWQRAQRAWQQMGIKPNQRPTIKKSNIVCAEPMPGEKELLKEFAANLNPPVLGHLVETIFDKMELAGEAGTLLKIEEEIQTAIQDVKKEYKKSRQLKLPGLESTDHQLLTTIHSDFWRTVEKRILGALNAYADHAESGDEQKRLFIDDAAKGFAFVDISRKRFDVVLMNPPFGAYSKKIQFYIERYYSDSKYDLYAQFIDRAREKADAFIGSITARTGFYMSSLDRWRRNVVPNVDLFADLGGGVLDNAMVETAAYVLKINKMRSEASIAWKLDEAEDKSETLRTNINLNIESNNRFFIQSGKLSSIPGSPYCYWLKNEFIEMYQNNDYLEPKYCNVYNGIQTDDDFRFVRAWWEVPSEQVLDPKNVNIRLKKEEIQSEVKQLSYKGTRWITIIKGGNSSRYYSPFYLVINWKDDAKELREFTRNAPGGRVKNENIYFLPYISWSLRTDYFSPHFTPSLTLPSVSRSVIVASHEKMHTLCFALNTELYDTLIKAKMEKWAQPKYISSAVQSLPECSMIQNENLHDEFKDLYITAFKAHNFNECDRNYKFDLITFDNFSDYAKYKIKTQNDLINNIKLLTLKLSQKIRNDEGLKQIDYNNSCVDFHGAPKISIKQIAESHVSTLMGITFGRWNMSSIKYNNCVASNPNPFDPLPIFPSCLADDDLNIQVFSIFTLDKTNNNNLVKKCKEILKNIWINDSEQVEIDLCYLLDVESLNKYFKNPLLFFNMHLLQYSKSRRKAPIYWPLQTPSCSYTLWIYYHRLTEQTLYTCVNDFVEPKLKSVADDLNGLRNKFARSNAEEKELARLSDLDAELRDFRDELLRLAKFWKPNLNDGVQITAAPLWKLFQHKQWQKTLKETWDNLEKGDYDWAQLAYSIWPERVMRKCHEDRSLAIAHEVENDFWEEIETPVIRRGKDTGETKLVWQPKSLSEAQLRELIRQKVAETK